MSRPRFLKLVSIVATGVPPLAAELMTNRRTTPTGAAARSDMWSHLKVGDAVDLVRETDNPFDNRAVRIDWQRNRLGYVPVNENRAIAGLLDRRLPVRGRIAALKARQEPWQGSRLEVWLSVVA
jgi:hypothetical protein